MGRPLQGQRGTALASLLDSGFMALHVTPRAGIINSGESLKGTVGRWGPVAARAHLGTLGVEDQRRGKHSTPARRLRA
jgi:hypothetical protein